MCFCPYERFFQVFLFYSQWIFIFSLLFLDLLSSKPRGLHAARKLHNTRIVGRWADKAYRRRVLATRWKADPLQKCSHAKGIVVEKMFEFLFFLFVIHLLSLHFHSGVEAKQPNSALRKCVRVQLVKNGKKVAAFVPRDGCLNFIDDNV